MMHGCIIDDAPFAIDCASLARLIQTDLWQLRTMMYIAPCQFQGIIGARMTPDDENMTRLADPSACVTRSLFIAETIATKFPHPY